MTFDVLAHVGGPALAADVLQAGKEGLGISDRVRLEAFKGQATGDLGAFGFAAESQHHLTRPAGVKWEPDATFDVEFDRRGTDDALEHDAFVAGDHPQVRGFAGLFAEPAHRRQRRFSQGDVVHERLAQAQEARAHRITLLRVTEQVAVRDEGLCGAVDEVGGQSQFGGDLREAQAGRMSA